MRSTSPSNRRGRKTPLEAIHEACLVRFRPIMMTTWLPGRHVPIASVLCGRGIRRPSAWRCRGLFSCRSADALHQPVYYVYIENTRMWLAGRRTSPLGTAIGAGARYVHRPSRSARWKAKAAAYGANGTRPTIPLPPDRDDLIPCSPEGARSPPATALESNQRVITEPKCGAHRSAESDPVSLANLRTGT